MTSYAATITSTSIGGLSNVNGTWVGNVQPIATDNVIIASGATVSLGASSTWANLTVTGALVMQAKDLIIDDLSGSGTISTSNTSALSTTTKSNTTFSGSMSGKINFTKYGTYALTLSGANTYTLVTIVSAGTLILGNPAALGSAAASDYTVINSGAALDLNGTNYSSTEFLRLNGTGISGGGCLINSSATTATYAGKIDLWSASTITTANPIIISGQIASSSLGYTKDGTSNLTVTSDNSTWGYAITISAGTLITGSTGALGSSGSNAVTVNAGAVLDLNGFSNAFARIVTLNGTGISGGGALINGSVTAATYSSNITLGSATTITANNPITLSGIISGSGALTVAGAGNSSAILTLSGANTYTNSTTITANAWLKLGSSSALGAGTGVDAVSGNHTAINSGGVLDLNGISYSSSLMEGVQLNGTGISGGGCFINSSSTAANFGGFVDTWTPATVNATNPITLSGGVMVRNSNHLTKEGVGTLTLAPTSGIRSGATIIVSAGIIQLGVNEGQTGATTIASGARWDLHGFSCARIVTINGTGLSGGGALINSSTTPATCSRAITLGSASSIVGEAGTITITGTITGAGFGLSLGGSVGGTITGIVGGASTAITKADIGTWTLSGLNTYTGATTISGGILRATNNSIAASTSGAFGNNASGLNLNGGSIQSNVATFSRPITITSSNSGLDAYGSSRTISSPLNNITSNSVFNLNIGGTTVTNAEGQNLILSGVISNSAGTLSLTKLGTSLLTLSAASTFSGGIILNSGQLNINHTTAIGSGTFIINGGTIDNTTAGSITLSNNNTQNWNGDFTLTGTQPLNMGTGAITLNADRQITVSANTLTVGGILNQGSLSLSKAGSGTFSFGNQAITLNNLTISAGTFSSTSGSVNLTGSFSNSGTFNTNNGTLNFIGNSPQSISGTFYNLTINNSTPGNAITLNGPVTVNNNLILTDGHIITSATNILKLGSSAIVTLNAPVTQDSSFVNGPMIQTVDVTTSTTKIFPVGKNNRMHRSDLTVIQNSATSTQYSSEYFNSSATALGYTLPSTIVNVSDIGYWVISKGAGASVTSTSAKLYYFDSDNVSDAPNLRITKDNGASAWTDIGGIGTAVPSGAIESTINFTSFSKFTLANNTGGGNALPISLLFFNARVNGSKIDLNWATASEANNNYFTIDKSIDGKNFNLVTTVSGAGNSNDLRSYNTVDLIPYEGNSYYRLMQTDYDGNFTYSKLVSVRTDNNFNLSVFPNPLLSGQAPHINFSNVSGDSTVHITVYDVREKELASKIYTISCASNNIMVVDLLEKLIPGVYFITISYNQSTSKQRLLVN